MCQEDMLGRPHNRARIEIARIIVHRAHCDASVDICIRAYRPTDLTLIESYGGEICLCPFASPLISIAQDLIYTKSKFGIRNRDAPFSQRNNTWPADPPAPGATT
jgi:hypothetical protein